MLRSVRPTTPEDAPEIAALLTESGLSPPMNQAEMQWKYWQTRDDWPDPRSYVFTQDQKVLAHASLVPGILTWDGGRMRTLHMIDWAAKPQAVGAGVALLKHIGRLTDALLAIGGSPDTLKILPRIGFRPLGRTTEFVRPLHPLRILRCVPGRRWKLLARTVRSACWLTMAPSAGARHGNVCPIGAEDIPAITGGFPLPLDGMATFERSTPLLRHVLSCPMTPTRLYAWEQAQGARGYFVLAFAPGQARLADYWTPSTDPAHWRSLILCAVREAERNTDAAELVAWASESRLARALIRTGFHVRGAQPISLLAPGIFAPKSIRVQMLDNDTAYNHRRRVELWA